MELTDSSEIATRSPLFIDLNEIPSASTSSPPSISPSEPLSVPIRPETDPSELDSLDVVRSFHENQDPAFGTAAGLPEEERLSLCGACGKPEAVMDDVVVCDGCERGFHLTCAGMNGKEEAAVKFVDWICRECVNNGVRSKRWPLGVNTSKRILDINASPPSDCDGDGDHFAEERKHALGDNSFSANSVGTLLTYSNRFYAGDGHGPFDVKKSFGLRMKNFRVGVGDILHHAQTTEGSLDSVGLDCPLARLRSSNDKATRAPSQSPNEILLQGLRDFISDRHGKLEEGWHAELKHNTSGYEGYIAYCSPDGKTFGSMSEVACYLGLTPSSSAMDTDTRTDGNPSLQERFHLTKKRKSTRFSQANGHAESKEALINGHHKGLLSNGHQSAETGNLKFGKIAEADTVEEDTANSPPSNEGLPIQYEDFFLISLGKIDGRPSYHDLQLIWPVGYRSYWHDKITRSLFVCEVLDGGDSGPLFRVRRLSCSAMPIPDSSTILYRKNLDEFSDHKRGMYYDWIYNDMDHDSDGSVEIILADTSPPREDDILTCLRHTSNKTCDVQTSSNGRFDSICNLGLEDEIGEFAVEERSSSSAWRLVSQKLIKVYSEIYKRTGIINLYCKHVDDEMGLLTLDTDDKMSAMSFASLAKFCSTPSLVGMPFKYQAEIDSLIAALSKWLDQDRFGFELEFVQEIIEQLPDVGACSNYEFLVDRSIYSKSLTVGNGSLLAKKRNGEEMDKSVRGCKKPRMGKDSETNNHNLPPARKLCFKLPPVLVGDLYQVWELLRRFCDLLGLKEPLSSSKLEEDLVNPCFSSTKFSVNLQRKDGGNQVIDSGKVDGMSGPVSSSCQESLKAINEDVSHVLVQTEKGGINDAAQDRLESVTQSKCYSEALTEIHSSLLYVLISELQSRVAAVVDPSFDSGDLKSKRGRKKDVDNSIPIRRSKLMTLPINELTWPELARRYILTVLSMEGNLDSTEIIARESGKVFRCLRGDGGVLCGSLAGVAAMEADALLLAEATKQIYGSLNRENDTLILEDEVTDADDSCEKNGVNDGKVPEWAQMLEPVKKLPTNVGTRIRKCVYEALGKSPPAWAKTRLEHSISKEVYKGNASGPTKKAVLSVLADVLSEGLPQKSEKKNKRKITVHVSEIIMKKCRMILRHVAAADDEKVFCTLLGRNLTNSCDHDDEGLLGSPGMVSRPLDFRTIDLRLAAGAYGGSHESFLEDVRQLWKNVCTAFRDQPDVIELADKLSQNFESLYQEEVVTLVRKFEGFAKLDHLSAETKKELDDVFASTNEIPKAPWDEGVCKVCGVDKDDDSVLLCDTCDAEYHTYCLNPPLARIPEGNWYCPSCFGVHLVQEASGNTQVSGQSNHKKCQGEINRVYFEMLMHLAAAMEQNDYWNFGVDERIFLLKFLCDELLNTALVRQHLEHCVESTAELQHKLRSLYVELKNLKSKEEFLALRSARMCTGASGEPKGVHACALTNQQKSVEQPPALVDKSIHCCTPSDEVPAVDGCQEGNGVNGLDKHSSKMDYERKPSSGSQTVDSINTSSQVKDPHAVMDGNTATPEQGQLSLSNHSPQADHMVEPLCQGDVQGCVEKETPDHPGSSVSEMNIHVVENVLSAAMKESRAFHDDLSSIKDDIVRVQKLICSIESQLLRQSMRKEFLGSDSRGRLYWASATILGHPQIVVDGTLTFERRQMSNQRWLPHSDSSGINSCLNFEGSNACFPFVFNQNDNLVTSSAWVSYETDAEIEGLIGWLGHESQKEIELKESIMQWLKSKHQDTQLTRDPIQEECQTALSMIKKNDTIAFPNHLVTKAALFLEKKYGACVELDTLNMSNKQVKKAQVTKEEQTYRCDCLEMIWPSRNHCCSCHRTSSNDAELEGHHDGKCSFVPQSFETSEETNGPSRVMRNLKAVVTGKEISSEAGKLHASTSGLSELGSRLIKFQHEGFSCPHDLVDICSKFVTKDSNKELVQDIGLIGTDGIPLFISPVAPYLSDSMSLLMSPEEDVKVPDGDYDIDEKMVFKESKWNESSAIVQQSSANFTRKMDVHEDSKESKPGNRPLGCFQQKGGKSSLDKSFPAAVPSCCVVPESSLRPLDVKVSLILRQLKINLLDMEAALAEQALRPAKGKLGRWAWRKFVKSAESIYQMVQATIMLEEMIKTEHLRNEWWYWSSLSAAAKTSTLASLALRIYSLDACIIYEMISNSDPGENSKYGSRLNQKPSNDLDLTEKCRVTRKTNKKRKEPEG